MLLGFPQDEGVRRNGGRQGAAEAPAQIRRWLAQMVPGDPRSEADLRSAPPIDVGNVRIAGSLEDTQEALGRVVAALLGLGAAPIVLGGGHETAYGVYQGYVEARMPVGIVNLDAHLDVRPCLDGRGTSGTPFRQALEHPANPLPGQRYVCIGAQPHAVSRAHAQYALSKGCIVRWRDECADRVAAIMEEEVNRLANDGCAVHVSLDADVVAASVVPGVSAPNVSGLAAGQVLDCLEAAGRQPSIRSLELVEINPRCDVDGQSSRWAALAVWHFLMGVLRRRVS